MMGCVVAVMPKMKVYGRVPVNPQMAKNLSSSKLRELYFVDSPKGIGCRKAVVKARHEEFYY
jgi:hypothetical protein